MIKPMKNKIFWLCAALVLFTITAIDPALANEPLPWQKGLQPSATPVMERINDFHNMLLYVITAISAFVILLMLFILLRFNARTNPEPSKTTHNVPLEIIWTVLPVVILILIAIPSLKLLYYADKTADPEMTIKVTGYQWYWNYAYMDGENEISFDSRMIQDDDEQAIAEKGADYRRLLSTDTPLVLPTDTNIQILVTAGPDDVLHAFAVPAFGVKLDAVPGRINETWTNISKPGLYFGQCSELCGQGHAYMPIEIRAVPQEEFEAWMEFAQEEYASYEVFKAQRTIELAKAEGLE